MTPGIKRTRKEIKKIVGDLGYKLLDEYIGKNYNRRIVVKDKFGYKYDVLLMSVIRNYNLRIVHESNIYSLDNISTWLKLNNKYFELCEDNIYAGNQEKLFFHCFVCDENFDNSWANIYMGQSCSFCSGRRVGKHNNLEYLRPNLTKEWNYEFNEDSPENYTCHSPIKKYWTCSECNYGVNGEWFIEIYSRSNGYGCPSCSGRVVSDGNRLSILFPKMASEWHPTKNGDLTPEDISYGSAIKVWWICPNGHEYYSRIASRTNRGSGCNKCNDSKGETRIGNWLINNRERLYQIGICEFIGQKKFDECKNERMLPFDFGLTDTENNWYIIEYHGEQHYIPKEFFGGKKQFKLQIKLDKIKVRYCKNNNVPLLIIPYWDFENIEKILEKTLFG